MKELKFEQEAKERKLTNYKNMFSFSKKCMIFTTVFYLVSIVFGMVMLSEYKKSESRLLVLLMDNLEDKILIEDDYLRESFYRTIDIAMLSKIMRRVFRMDLFKP